MSKNKLIALAIAGALVSPAAFAASITPTVTPVVHSNQFVDDADIALVPNTTFAATDSDNYLGRTVGYNFRVTFSAGEIFAPGPTVTATGGAAGAAIVAQGVDANGKAFIVVNVQPNATTGTKPGEGFILSNLQLDNVESLGTGGSISASGAVFDPTTAIELPGSSFSKNILTAAEGIRIIVTPTATPNVIDVGQSSGKRLFALATGTIGSGTTGILFNAGSIVIDEAAGLFNPTWLPASAADVTISGVDFSAFRTSTATGNTAASVYLGDATCATSIAALTIAADGKSASASNVAVAAGGQTWNVCFDANSVTQIASQDLTATVEVQPLPATDFLSYTRTGAALASMDYNGPVKRVVSFNPASNPSIDSLLRVVNTSGSGGLVSIEADCQDGTSRGPISFTLKAGNAVQYGSAELESGSAGTGKPPLSGGLTSCGGGRSLLTVTGEFSSMEVQNFLRSNTSVGVITGGNNNQD